MRKLIMAAAFALPMFGGAAMAQETLKIGYIDPLSGGGASVGGSASTGGTHSNGGANSMGGALAIGGAQSTGGSAATGGMTATSGCVGCISGQEYCRATIGGAVGRPGTYICTPLPSACMPVPTCACLSTAGVSGQCTVGASGDLTVTLDAPSSP